MARQDVAGMLCKIGPHSIENFQEGDLLQIGNDAGRNWREMAILTSEELAPLSSIAGNLKGAPHGVAGHESGLRNYC
jgi:hypothetical protein